MEKVVTYLGQKARVACDEKCNKAWGLGFNGRPHFYLEIGDKKVFGHGQEKSCPDIDVEDEDNIAWLSDDELGDAPESTGTWEGGDAKPTCDEEKGNKWCVRACERCVMTPYGGDPNEPLELEDWSKRLYNKPLNEPK